MIKSKFKKVTSLLMAALKLYQMTNREDCPFVLWIGNRRLIKREVFNDYKIGRAHV